MGPNEVFEYVTEGVKWLVIVGVGYYFYDFVVLRGLNLTHVFSQRIRSQGELERVVEEEAQILGLDPAKINAIYNGGRSNVLKNGETYDLSLSGNPITTNRAGVRHELYHIYKGDAEHSDTFFKYMFLQEPRALLYGSFKLKI